MNALNSLGLFNGRLSVMFFTRFAAFADTIDVAVELQNGSDRASGAILIVSKQFVFKFQAVYTRNSLAWKIVRSSVLFLIENLECGGLKA